MKIKFAPCLLFLALAILLATGCYARRGCAVACSR